MNINLSPDQEKFVQSKIQAGEFPSADEVLSAALFLMEEQETALAMDVEDVRAKIEQGWQSLREGRSIDGEEFFARLEAELDALAQASQK